MGMSVPFHVFPFMVDKIPLDSSLSLSLSGNRIVLFPCHTLKPFTSQGDIFQAPLVPFIPGCCEGSRKTLLVRVKFQIAFWKRLYCFQSVQLSTFLWHLWSSFGTGMYEVCWVLVSMRVISLSQFVGCLPVSIYLPTRKIALTCFDYIWFICKHRL